VSYDLLEYAPLVRETFGGAGVESDGGLLVRHGRPPMDRGELQEAPKVPFELMGPAAQVIPPA
jgi:hypothetical protein